MHSLKTDIIITTKQSTKHRRYISLEHYWKPRVVMIPTLSLLATLQVAITTTCGVDNDDKIGIMTTPSFQWLYITLTFSSDWWQGSQTLGVLGAICAIVTTVLLVLYIFLRRCNRKQTYAIMIACAQLATGKTKWTHKQLRLSTNSKKNCVI